jgi:hypothetical protein
MSSPAARPFLKKQERKGKRQAAAVTFVPPGKSVPGSPGGQLSNRGQIFGDSVRTDSISCGRVYFLCIVGDFSVLTGVPTPLTLSLCLFL